MGQITNVISFLSLLRYFILTSTFLGPTSMTQEDVKSQDPGVPIMRWQKNSRTPFTEHPVTTH